MGEYAIMDNKGIIEDFDTEEECLDSFDKIFEEQKDIKGDLIAIQILERRK